jgi:hypothetical protein
MCSLCLNFFSPTCLKPNLEKKKLYLLNQILSQFSFVRIQFYLSRASGKRVSTRNGSVPLLISFIFNFKFMLCICIIAIDLVFVEFRFYPFRLDICKILWKYFSSWLSIFVVWLKMTSSWICKFVKPLVIVS